jgi:hypothetical protein
MLSAPASIRLSIAESLTGSRLLADTGPLDRFNVTAPPVEPEPPNAHGATPVPLGQKMVTPGYLLCPSGAMKLVCPDALGGRKPAARLTAKPAPQAGEGRTAFVDPCTGIGWFLL